jgi:propionyl-CoA synthetase
VASLSAVMLVEKLPKTRSGKVMRRTIRSMVAGESVEVPPTLEDPGALDGIAHALERAAV